MHTQSHLLNQAPTSTACLEMRPYEVTGWMNAEAAPNLYSTAAEKHSSTECFEQITKHWNKRWSETLCVVEDTLWATTLNKSHERLKLTTSCSTFVTVCMWLRTHCVRYCMYAGAGALCSLLYVYASTNEQESTENKTIFFKNAFSLRIKERVCVIVCEREHGLVSLTESAAVQGIMAMLLHCIEECVGELLMADGTTTHSHTHRPMLLMPDSTTAHTHTYTHTQANASNAWRHNKRESMS